jgi:hypothetical protein
MKYKGIVVLRTMRGWGGGNSSQDNFIDAAANESVQAGSSPTVHLNSVRVKRFMTLLCP